MIRSPQSSSASRKWRSVFVSAALLTRMSSPPKRSPAAANSRSQSSREVTSQATPRPSARPPATSAARSPSMSATTTRAPSAAYRSAIARPMPPAPPVTIATLPTRRPSGIAVLPSAGQRRPVEPEPADVVVGAALGGEVGQDPADHHAELEAVPRAGRGDHDLRVLGVAVDDEVLVRGHRVAAGGVAQPAAGHPDDRLRRPLEQPRADVGDDRAILVRRVGHHRADPVEHQLHALW